MQGNNYWADNASAYLASEAAAKVHENAKKCIRDMIEADVGTAHGYGVVAKRAKNGAITIRKGEL
jgi:hypothetical protein